MKRVFLAAINTLSELIEKNYMYISQFTVFYKQCEIARAKCYSFNDDLIQPFIGAFTFISNVTYQICRRDFTYTRKMK